ncbi:MAG: hypothetical protein M3Y41_01810 [Pseudomonadota bacterium]|nr:hypothetical protein [Pseudomonadota bacterium]
MATAAAKPPEEADENLWFRHPWEDEPADSMPAPPGEGSVASGSARGAG